MKTDHSELNKKRIGDSCCKESGTWIKIHSKIRKAARWSLWVLALLLIGLYTLGYFLDPSTIRILWLVISGVLLIVVLPLIAFWRSWMNQCEKECKSEKSTDQN